MVPQLAATACCTLTSICTKALECTWCNSKHIQALGVSHCLCCGKVSEEGGGQGGGPKLHAHRSSNLQSGYQDIKDRSILAHLWVYLQVKHETNSCMLEEETQAGLNITGILDIHGMPSQGYAGDNATMPWHKQASRKDDGCSPFEGSPKQGGLLHHR